MGRPFEPSKPRCVACGGHRRNFAQPGREFCRLHDPELAEERSRWGATRKARDPNAPPKAPRRPRIPAEPRLTLGALRGDADAEPTFADIRDRSPTIVAMVSMLIDIHDDMKGLRFVKDPLSGKWVRQGCDPMAGRVAVAAVKAAADVLHKERQMQIQERLADAAIRKGGLDAPPDTSPRTIEDEFSGFSPPIDPTEEVPH